MTSRPSSRRSGVSATKAKSRTVPLPAVARRDAFALAAERLHAERPMRDARLRHVAASLAGDLPLLAQADLRDILAERPDDPDALSLMAKTAQRLGRADEAIDCLQRCVAVAPDAIAQRHSLIQWLVQRHEYSAALPHLNHLLTQTQEHDNPLLLLLKANLLETLGDGGSSLALCERLVDLHPERADLWVRLGHALRAVGQREACVVAYRQAIERQPDSGAAYWSLANLKNQRLQGTDIAEMQRQLQRPDLPATERAPMQFALAKALEDQGQLEAAFSLYHQANTALRKRIEYDPRTLSSGVARNKQVYTPEFLRSRAGAGCRSNAPIFVLGRPRSGSTLVEQILSSHSAIEGTSELPYIASMAERMADRVGPAYDSRHLLALQSLPDDALAALGDHYLRQTQAHRHTDRPHFIDKKPVNFLHIGLIHLILPEARIIDVRRHPAACTWSIFKSYSNKGRLRLNELALYYRDYLALMAHFDAVLPGRIYRVHYEQLVAQPEIEVRRLLDHLGLPFEAQCLRFHETQRTLLTPSSEQVRRPITTEAVDHWRQFEPWLGELIDGLGSALTAYPAVPGDLSSDPGPSA